MKLSQNAKNAIYISLLCSLTYLFANAVEVIGWGNLILVWFALMVAGVLVIKIKNKLIPSQTEA